MSDSQVIGITGGIGTGKTYVCKIIAKMGFPVLNSDQIAHRVLRQNWQAIKAIKRHFGSQVITSDGVVNRQKLGLIVFQNPPELKILNQILAPYLRIAILDQINNAPKPVFIEIPLLYEQNYQNILDQVIVVYADNLTAAKRIQVRDQISKKMAINKIESQMPIEEKVKMTKYRIDTTKNQISEQIRSVLEDLRLPSPKKE